MKLTNLLLRNNNYFFLIGIVSVLIIVLFYFLIPFRLIDNNAGNEVVISYADNISSSHQIIIDKFNNEYKGRIRVKTIDLPFLKFSTNERKELLARSLRSKSDKLDVFAVDLIWSARFARWAENLDSYITQSELNEVLPTALSSCYYEEKLVALPIYLDIGIMYYRKDLIRSLPDGEEIEKRLKESITWEEFLKLGGRFQLQDNPYYIFPADNYEGLVCSFMEILFNQDPNFFKDTSFNWQSDHVNFSMQLLADLIHKYNLTPIAVTDYDENTCYEYFIKNNGVFLRGWPSFTKDYKNALKSQKIDSLLEKAPLPHIKGSNPMSVLGGWNIMLSKYSENKKEAFEFIKFIMREENQKSLYENGAYLPVLTKIYNDKKFMENHPDLNYDKKVLDNGVHRPFLDNYTKISDIISFYTNQVLKGNLTVDSALISTNKSYISGELIVR